MTTEQQLYAPPQSHVSDVLQSQPQPRPWLALVTGTLVDLGGSVALSVLLGIGYALHLSAQGVPASQMEQTLTLVAQSPGFLLFGLIAGAAISTLAGYVCASLARESIFKWGGILGLVTALIGVVVTATQYSPLMNALLAVITFLFALVGTWLFARQQAQLPETPL